MIVYYILVVNLLLVTHAENFTLILALKYNKRIIHSTVQIIIEK